MKKELEPYTSLKDKPDSLFQVLLKSFYLAFGIESPIRDALYRKIIFKDKFLGSVPVYLVVLNKLKTCAINAPLLLLSTGEKQKEFCRWLIDDAKGLTIEEQVTYRSYMIAYGVVEDEEVRKQMGRKVLRPNYDNLVEVIDENLPPEVKIEFIQKLLRADSLEKAVLALVKSKEKPEELLEFLRRNLEEKPA